MQPTAVVASSGSAKDVAILSPHWLTFLPCPFAPVMGPHTPDGHIGSNAQPEAQLLALICFEMPVNVANWVHAKFSEGFRGMSKLREGLA